MSRRKKPIKPTASAFLPSEAFDLEIVAVCRTRSVVLLNDWETELDMQMLDGEGDETESAEEAVAGVVNCGDDIWITIDLTLWEKPTLH